MDKAIFYFANGSVKEWDCDDVETFPTHIVVRRLAEKSAFVAQSTVTYKAIAVVSMSTLLWWEPK